MVWTRQDDSEVNATSGSSLLLNLYPVRTSDGSYYTCTATVSVPDVVIVSGEESVNVVVPSKLIVNIQITLNYESIYCTII